MTALLSHTLTAYLLMLFKHVLSRAITVTDFVVQLILSACVVTVFLLIELINVNE